MRFPIPFYPHQPDANSYLVEKGPGADTARRPEDLPIPPPYLLLGHKSTEDFVNWGRDHARAARQAVEQAGFGYPRGARILDFGCGSGRMIRHFIDVARRCEIHGVDLRAEHILWCRRFLSPPFHFAVTTAWPHLPFEDRYFDVVYAGSVFTHLDDLAAAWHLEMWRVLAPGGLFYLTLHDHRTIAMLANELRDGWEAQQFAAHPEWRDFTGRDFAFFTLGRFEDSQVFHDTDDLLRTLEPHYETLSIRREAYGYQTGVLLRRRRHVRLTEPAGRGARLRRAFRRLFP